MWKNIKENILSFIFISLNDKASIFYASAT